VSDLSDPTTATLRVAAALDRAGLRGAVYGGLALAAYGEPRETKDADFAMASVALSDVIDALGASGVEAEPGFEKVRFGGNLVSRVALLAATGATGLNVLVVVQPRSDRLAKAVLDRAMEGQLRGQTVRVVSPEDFVLLKILSTRDRDYEDAATVLRALGDRLDVALLDEEAATLADEIPDHDVRGMLARVRAAAWSSP